MVQKTKSGRSSFDSFGPSTFGWTVHVHPFGPSSFDRTPSTFFSKILFQNIISLIQLENDCEEEMLNQAQNCYSLLKDFLKGKWKGKPPSLQLTTPEQIESVHF